MPDPPLQPGARDADPDPVRSQPPWSDAWFRRYWVERAPPLTWGGIAAWAFACASGAGIMLAHPSGALLGLGGVPALLGGVLALRGLLRKAWLALGRTDQPLRSLIRQRLGE